MKNQIISPRERLEAKTVPDVMKSTHLEPRQGLYWDKKID